MGVPQVAFQTTPVCKLYTASTFLFFAVEMEAHRRLLQLNPYLLHCSHWWHHVGAKQVTLLHSRISILKYYTSTYSIHKAQPHTGSVNAQAVQLPRPLLVGDPPHGPRHTPPAPQATPILPDCQGLKGGSEGRRGIKREIRRRGNINLGLKNGVVLAGECWCFQCIHFWVGTLTKLVFYLLADDSLARRLHFCAHIRSTYACAPLRLGKCTLGSLG